MISLSEYLIGNIVENTLYEALPDGLDIVREYKTLSGKRIDLVIARGFEKLAVIEIKNRTDISTINKAKQQILQLRKEVGALWAIVTDGNTYYINSSIKNDGVFIKIKEAKDVINTIVKSLNDNSESIVVEDDNSFSQLRAFLNNLCNDFRGKIDTIDKITDVLRNISNLNCSVSATEYVFSKEFENKLFLAILGEYDKTEVVRYVPFQSAFRILNDQTIGMVSLVGMNDISECYYADKFFMKGDENENQEMKCTILPAERALLNNTYILSCNDVSMQDNLTIWRLYGDNCKGICIKFVIDKSRLEKGNDFILAPISYGEGDKQHDKLDLIYRLLTSSIDNKKIRFNTWCYWKHFFKDYRYSIENEVRLLYTGSGCGRKSWILTTGNEIPCPISIFDIRVLPKQSNDFPLTVSEVWMGSKCLDTYTKQEQLKELIKERNEGFDKGYAKVEVSTIDNYR